MKNTNTIITTFILTALVVGGGVYLWQKSEQKPITEVKEETVAINEQEKMYEDDFLSFEYPENVELLFKKPMGDRSDYQSIEFLVYDKTTNTYNSTNLSLSYIVSLGESKSSSFNNIDELLSNYKKYGLKTYEYAVDGKRAVQIVTGDMTGETFFLVIPANDSGDAYRFNGAFMSETVKEILKSFTNTAKLNQ